MPKLATQILTPIVHRFISDWVVAIHSNPQDPPIAELKCMMRNDPVSGLCVQMLNLYVLAAMGKFTHPKKRVETHTQRGISKARGSWKSNISQMLSFVPYGRSFSEVAYGIDTKAYVREIRTLDPERYHFEGRRGEITNVVYRGLEDIPIPYQNGIHLTNEPHLCFGDPLGIAAAVRAYPYWKLHQLLLPILTIASQRQATPILIYKTDTAARIEIADKDGQPIIGPDGEPMTVAKGEEAVKAIEALEEAGAMAIDLDEEVASIEQKVAADFLMLVIKLCEQYRMMSFLVPSTIASFSSSGVGDAGLAQSQREVFEAICAARAEQLSDQIVEQILKPMIIFNHGEQEDYGEFPVSSKDPQALEIADRITQAVQRGAFVAEDEKMVERLRDLLGVEEPEEEIKRAVNKPKESTQPDTEEDPDPAIADE